MFVIDIQKDLCYNENGKDGFGLLHRVFYNRKRLHSTLGYMRPVAYRLAFMQ